MDKNKHIKTLIDKISGDRRLTQQELEESEAFMNTFMENSEIDHFFNQQWNKVAPEHDTSHLTFQDIHAKIQNKPSKQIPFLRIIGQVAAAISIPIILVTGWYLTHEEQTPNQQLAHHTISTIEQSNLNNIVLTTGDKAYNLSGEDIKIDGQGLTLEGTNEMLKLMQSSNDQSQTKTKKVEWSTISIPRGRDYYVELADGTQVWINAGSKLTFPTSFSNDKRLVQLEGEAYFKVKSDVDHPFYVKTPYETVCVTGTQFNVCAYNDEPATRITLAEGKVSVNINEQVHQLQPGEQLKQIKGQPKVSISKVDVDLYTSWRNGVFVFKDMPLKEISYRLSKWYDVEFEFEDSQLLNQRFTGMTKKDYDIEYFLNVIEKTSNVKFKMTKTNIKVTELY